MKKKIAEKKRMPAQGSYVFDADYLDAHHLAIIACLGTLPCAIPHRASEGSEAVADLLGILVGLGGGSLVMGLQHHYPSGSLLVCDLDDHMETLATKFFGFSKQRQTHVFAQEGVEFLGQIRHQADALSRDKIVGPTVNAGDDPGMSCPLCCITHMPPIFHSPITFLLCIDLSALTLKESSIIQPLAPYVTAHRSASVASYIVIDVDGKDPSLRLTAPPAAFIAAPTLRLMHDLLVPGGALVINTVARGGEEPVNELIAALKAVFQHDQATAGSVYVIKPSDENVNLILFGVKGGQRADTALRETYMAYLRWRSDSEHASGMSPSERDLLSMATKVKEV